MSHELKTERLILTQLNSDDAEDFRKLITNDEVITYCFDPLSEEDIQKSFESRIKAWDNKQSHWLCLAVYLNNKNEFIGVNGFRNTSNQKEVEVGFMFLPEYQGHGFATESLKVVLSYAISLGYESVVANVTLPNESSSRVLEKCNFREAARDTGSIVIGGKFYTNVSYFYNNCANT